ncbi:MAG: hypothetical protein H8F28_26275 [Fibrella sp.]|nr:hypothetical protein [Armatimonadota bacterium]
MSDSEQDWMQREIERLTHQIGDVPPPWTFSPNSHPYSIEWRMGAGEGYLMVLARWWESANLDEAERIAYFRKYPPPPRWLQWMIDTLWDIRSWEQEEFDYTPYFDRVQEMGFGSKADFDKDISDPKWLDE